MQNFVGQQIDRYRITERLGMGGMAVVYKAYDTRLERHVALKLIRTSEIPESQHDRLMKRFEREAKAQASFNHRHIVPVHDYGEVDGSPYLVMAYVPGGTLKDQTGTPVNVRKAIGWLIPIADALAYAHKRGVVHRDIKPSNILMDDEGQPILTDFGIAKILETDEATLTGTGLGVGTPEYMAPEQWQGKSSEASDQYALGVVLYELLTGQKPYKADTPAAVAILQATEPLRSPRQLQPGIPEGVEKLLYKAMARDPQDRYETMVDFRQALEDILPMHFESVDEKLTTRDEFEGKAFTVNSVNPDDSESATLDVYQPASTTGLSKPISFKPVQKILILLGLIGIVMLGIFLWRNDSLFGQRPSLTVTAPANVSVMETELPVDTAVGTQPPTEVAGGDASELFSADSVLYFEDFEDGKTQQMRNMSQNWIIITDETGNLVFDNDNSSGSGFPGFGIGEESWRDYEIQFRFRFFEANDRWVIVYFRGDDVKQNSYNISLTVEGVSLHYTARGSGWHPITFREYPLMDNTWYTVRIIAVDEDIQVYIDDFLAINTDDPHFKYGTVGFQIGPYSHAQIDDVKVIARE